MKQSFFSKRAVALLLVLVIALTNLPDIVFAWGEGIFSSQPEQTQSDDGQTTQVPGITLSFAPKEGESSVRMGETGTFYMNVNVPETIDTQIAVRLPQHALQAINQAQPEGVQWMDTMGGSVPVQLYQDGDSTILQFSLSAGQALVNQPLNLLYQNGYNEEISIPVTEQDITVNETWLPVDVSEEPNIPETPEETLPPTDGDVEVPGEGEAPGEGEVPGDGETGDVEVPEGGETGDAEVPGDGETGDIEVPGDGETGDIEVPGDGETGEGEVPEGGETGDVEVPEGGETGDAEVPGGSETGDGEVGGETDGSEVGGETGGVEVGGETGGSETGESEAGKEELSNAQQQEQFQTEGDTQQQESQSEGTVELQGVQIVKEFVARPSTELEPQGNNGEPADQPQDGEPAGQQQDDEPAGQQQDDDPADQPEDGEPAGQQQDDDPAGQQQDGDPAGQQQDDDPADQQQDDDPADQQQDDDPAGQQQDGDGEPADQPQDGEPTEQPENTTPPQVIHQISGGTLTFAVQPFSWGELSLVEGPAEPDDGQPKRSDLFETQPRTVSKVFAMSSVLYQMGMVQQAERTIYKNNGQSASLSKNKTSSGEETPKERIIDQDFSYHVTIQSENDAQTGTIYTKEWTLEQSFTLPQGLQYPTGNAQVVGNQVLIGEVPVVTIENLDVTGNVSATAENISAVVNGPTLIITYIKTITDAENQDQELAAPDLQFVLHGSALKVLDEFAEGEIGVATSFKAISQTGEELTRSASAATPLSLGAAPDEGDPVPTEPSKIEVKYELLNQPTFSDKGELQVTYQITVENTSEAEEAKVIITMNAPTETDTTVAPTVGTTSDGVWNSAGKTIIWGDTAVPVTIAADGTWERTVTVTLTDVTQNNPPTDLKSSVSVASSDASAGTTPVKKEYVYNLKEFLEDQKETVSIKTKATYTKEIFWIDDNNTGNRPNSTIYRNGMQLAFCVLNKGENMTADQVAADRFTTLTAANMAQVGLTSVSIPTINTSGDHWTASASLPSNIYYGGDENNARQVVWKYVPKNDVPNYTLWDTDNVAGGTQMQTPGWYYLLEEPFTFTVELRNGAGTDPGTSVIRNLIINNFTLYYEAKDIQDGTGEITLSALLDSGSTENNCVVTAKGDGTYEVKITGLGTYTANGDRVQYALHTNGNAVRLENTGIGDTGDWLDVEYKTNGVVNTQLFDEDMLVLTLQGTTEYEANKVWLDDGTATRPEGRFELWRYRPGKETWKQASAVRDADGKILTVDLSIVNEEQTINFGNVQLDKYGPEGYEYTYICKEILEDTSDAGNYEQVFGEVDVDGNVTDTLPQGMTERETGNIYVYNNGTLTNRITDSRPISATKRWEASSFQSQLSDFVVELQLYSRPKDSPEDTPWEIVEGKVLKMTGFTSEQLQQSDSMSVPTYDDQGQPLEYKFMEAKVYLSTDPDKKNLMTEDKDGKPIIRWTKENGQEVIFESIQPTEDEIQKGNAAIVNKVKDTINYDFTKIWQNGWTAEELQKVIDNGGVTFKLYSRGRDGQNKELFEVTLDGTKDDPATIQRVTIGQETYNVTVQELGALSKDQIGEDAAHWPVHIEGLPRYDEGGYQLEYFVFEKDTTSYVANYDIERDPVTGDYDGEVINPPPIGTGHRILIRKRWIDDSDLYHREDVTITAYYYVDGENDIELGEVVLEKNGVGMDYLNINSDALVTANIITKNPDTGAIDWDGYKSANVYVLETKVGEVAPVTDGKAVEKEGQYLGEANKVLAKHHDYEITYSILKNGEQGNIADEDVYVVTNRRLGSIDITATKTWQDGGKLRDALEKAKIKPVLVLEFADQDKGKTGYEIDDVNNTVTLGGEAMQIQDNTGKASKAILPLNLDGTDTTGENYYFYNLPKYNVRGEVAHYTITEMWYQGTGTTNISIDDCVNKETLIRNLDQTTDAELIELLEDCDSIIQPGKYENGHDGNGDDTDNQLMSVTNKLSGTKDVSFHKTWIDHYVYRILDKRPDIYLTLYRLDNETGKLDSTPYYDRNWRELDGTKYEEYQWTCHFEDLPKYDEEGREIFYYATERMAADGENFDYKPVELSYVTETGTIEGDSTNDIDGNAWKLKVGEEYAVLEGGTFTNRLEAPAKISGVKLWDNLPYLWQAKDLPTVTFTITQDGVRLSGDEDTGTGTGTGESEGTDEGEGTGDGADTGTDKGEVIASITIDTGVWTSALRTDFEFTYKGDWKMGADGKLVWAGGTPEQHEEIPKYNENGQQYIYTLTETIKFPDNQVEEEDQVFSKIESSGYQIKNEYNPTLGAIQVKKLLEVGKGWEKYPAVTIELVRQYTDGKNYYEDAGFEPVELTWSSKEVEGEAAKAAATDPSATTVILDSGNTFTFKELPVYQPNGYQYRYYVREKVVDYLNYTSGVQTGNVEVANFEGVFLATNNDGVKDGNYLKYKDALEPTPNENNTTATNLKVSATFGDKYEEGTIDLTGKKAWEDQNNALELRPELDKFKESLKLYRWAPAQSGQGNGIGTAYDPIPVPDENLDGSKWEWKWEPDTNDAAATAKEWTYTIENLEKFAPNGMEWKYVVKENTDGLDGYYYYPKSASANVDSSNNDTYTMQTLTNSLKIKLNFSKEWQEKDGTHLTNDYLGLGQITITGELYVAEGDGNLQPASQYFKDADGNFKDPWANWFKGGYEFTKELKTTIGSTKTAPFANLPRVNKDGKPLYYTVAETKVEVAGLTQEYTVQVDGRKITYVSPADGALGGLFTPQNISSPSGATTGSISIVMRNTMPTQELNVEKKWTDELGADLTTDLPTEVNLVVQRQSSASAGNWTNVTDGDGNPLVVTLKSSGFWKATISKLPTNGIENDKVVTYTYRARELKADWKGPNVAETDILADDAKFGSEFTVFYPDDTTVTNKRTHMTLTAEKQWKPSAPNKGDEVTLTLYQRLKGGEWTKFKYDGDTSAEVKLDGEADAPNETCYASAAWTATWKNLPRADENGTLYEYRVEETVDDSMQDNLFGIVPTDPIDSTSTDKKFTVKNLPMGQLHIEKEDGDGNALAGVVFELQYKDSTGNWLPIDKNVCKAATFQVQQTTDADGKLTYTHLLLTDENGTQISYRIVEVSTPDGYNRLTEPIAVSFEALTTEKPALSWTISGNKLLASEVTYTIHNNQYFQTVNTGAGGFFWPGVAGAGAACAGVWYLANRKLKRYNKRHSDR